MWIGSTLNRIEVLVYHGYKVPPIRPPIKQFRATGLPSPRRSMAMPQHTHGTETSKLNKLIHLFLGRNAAAGKSAGDALPNPQRDTSLIGRRERLKHSAITSFTTIPSIPRSLRLYGSLRPFLAASRSHASFRSHANLRSHVSFSSYVVKLVMALCLSRSPHPKD